VIVHAKPEPILKHPRRESAACTIADERHSQDGVEMGRRTVGVLYAVAMAALITGVDLMFFRNRFWERLMVNIGIALVSAAFYLRFLKHP
jgi:hypothetical protein